MLEAAVEPLEVGTLRPIIDRMFPLDDVPEAIRYLRHGRAYGKIVITTDARRPHAISRRVRGSSL